VCAPHTDDAELGCGGSICRYVEEGWAVHVAAFSRAEISLPAGSQPDRLEKEMYRALQSLGVPAEHVHMFRYPVRRFSEYRQDILEDMVRLRRAIAPRLVMTPASTDVHQDHAVVSQESIRAFRQGTLLGYELPWNHLRSVTNGFVALEERHMAAKLHSLTYYESQVELARAYFEPETLRGFARMRGVQAKAPFAEAFEVIQAIF
jgi:LmbE family N-acetylglucosaminyl deacetylase